MERLLEVENLARRFGPLVAVDAVTFAADRGEVLGFLGPNGAGKSTTMKMITGYLTPSDGTARVCGFDVVRAPLEVKRRLGYLPEGAPLYGDMTPASLLRFVADLHGLRGAGRRNALEQAVERLQLAEVMSQPIETLSKGFKRRVGLAQATLHEPDVLILDEPTDGLDPNQKQHVRALIRSLAERTAIVISTHILEEVEAVCSRAIVIARGRLVADARPSELLARSHYHGAVALSVAEAQAERARALLQQVANVAQVEVAPPEAGQVRLLAMPANNGDALLGEVQKAISAEGIQAREIAVERGRLDEVFLRLTAA